MRLRWRGIVGGGGFGLCDGGDGDSWGMRM